MPPAAAQIALPQISQQLKTRVKYPDVPQFPPTAADVADSIVLCHDVFHAFRDKKASNDEMANVFKYQTSLLASDQAAEPAWFSAAIRRELRHELDPIRQDIAEMRREVAAVHRMAAIVKSPSFHWFLADQMQTWNHSCGSGPDAKLVVVPFCSGEDPTKAPHNLPPLTTVRSVHDLNVGHRNEYCRGYYPDAPRPPPAAERTSLILAALGVVHRS